MQSKPSPNLRKYQHLGIITEPGLFYHFSIIHSLVTGNQLLLVLGKNHEPDTNPASMKFSVQQRNQIGTDNLMNAVVQPLSHVDSLAILWTVACHAPLSMGSPGENMEWMACLVQGIETHLSCRDRLSTAEPPRKPDEYERELQRCSGS